MRRFHALPVLVPLTWLVLVTGTARWADAPLPTTEGES
jgi:hypothetical protein